MDSCQCFVIGGPFIGADPDCPKHGTDAMAEEARREEADAEKDARIARLEERVLTLEVELGHVLELLGRSTPR